MKLRVLKCPECRANLEVEEDRAFCYCQYCGCKILLEEDKNETTINENIHKRYTDDAAILREINKEKKDKRDTTVGLIAGLGIPLAIILAIVFYFVGGGAIAKSQGKIQAGYYKDLIGQSYETVVAHFEAAGFTDIELIDLDDSGVAFWNNGKVEMISVGGDTDFETMDWFFPDTKVVISYH